MNVFGLTTSLFSGPVGEREIAAAARAGFRTLDLVATPGDVDLANASLLNTLATAAAAEGVSINAVAVPIGQAREALPVVAERGWPVLIALLGPCRHMESAPLLDPRSLRARLEQLAEGLPQSGPILAVQTPSSLVSPESLVEIFDSLEGAGLGACLDVGHAHLYGGAPEAAEVVSGLVVTTRLHDNNGREDLHRAPGDSAINWPAALTACWKTGFSGPWILDMAAGPDDASALTRAIGARARLQAILEDLAQPMAFTE